MIALSRSISDIRLSIMDGATKLDTVIGDADVIAHVTYDTVKYDPPILRMQKLVTTKPVTLYGEIGNYTIEAGVDIKDLLCIGKLREEEEAAQIDYEREFQTVDEVSV